MSCLLCNIRYNLERKIALWLSRVLFYMPLFDPNLCQILPEISQTVKVVAHQT